MRVLFSLWNHLVELAFDSGSRIRFDVSGFARADAHEADEPLAEILAGSGGCLSFVPQSRAVVEGCWAIVEVSWSSANRNGGLAGTRTLDQCLKRALLYQLSYQPTRLSGET